MAAKRKNPSRADGDNPEWTAEDFARAAPAVEVLPASLMRKVRGKQRTATKQSVTIRLSPDVVSKFRDSGKGWQSRMDNALREWLKRHSPQPD